MSTLKSHAALSTAMLIAATTIAATAATSDDHDDSVVDAYHSVMAASGPGYGSFVGIEITQPDFSDGYLLHDGSIVSESADAVSEAWQTFRLAWTVYRVWVTVTSENSPVAGVNGSQDNNVSIVLDPGDCGFFNTEFNGDTPPLAFAMSLFPELAFDTWVTIGSAESVNDLNIVDFDNLFQGLAGPVVCQNCAWARLPPPLQDVVPSGHGYHRVLLAQLTVPRGMNFDYALRVYMSGGFGYFERSGDIEWSCVDQCPWDTTPQDGNQVVNIDDLVEVVLHFGSSAARFDVSPDHGNGAYGDFIVGIDDMLGVIANFGECP